jgi:hypothetical protein
MKSLICCGSDVSASRPARLVGEKTSTWSINAIPDFGPAGRAETGVLNMVLASRQVAGDPLVAAVPAFEDRLIAGEELEQVGSGSIMR